MEELEKDLTITVLEAHQMRRKLRQFAKANNKPELFRLFTKCKEIVGENCVGRRQIKTKPY